MPTTDAHEALDGALTPLGGHKGFALGLAVGLLSGPVIGAPIGSELALAMSHGNGEKSRGHFFIALDPGTFGDVALAGRRTADFLKEITASRKAPGIGEIHIPGERGHRAAEQGAQKGVRLARSIWDNTLRIAKELNVAPPPVQADV